MTMIEQIAHRLERLPELRRREVLDFLAFVESQGEDDLGPEWDAELEARLRDVEAGRAIGRPVADVVREMRAKYG